MHQSLHTISEDEEGPQGKIHTQHLPGAGREQEIDAFLEPPDRIQSHQPLGLSSDLATMMKSPRKKTTELNTKVFTPPSQDQQGGIDTEREK